MPSTDSPSSSRRPSRLVTLRVNGKGYDIPLAPDRSLLFVLREELGLTGTKYGCGEGECGACKVLLDGVAVRACQTAIGEVAGRSVTTIEGLAQGTELHPVQRAFVESGAFQCGFCTPGMILQAVSLLRQKPDASEEEIRAGLNGNICRCGGYLGIIAAVQRASTFARPSNEVVP
ncbi:MAG TPA: (2Fe-2S)-binding protein [Thermoplasmata archaeon]|nr:(2Fe-2S)-binding protein [Thermoplasmata archaeon]